MDLAVSSLLGVALLKLAVGVLKVLHKSWAPRRWLLFGLYLQLKVRDNRPMVREINRWHAVVIKLLEVGAALPENPITERRHTLLLARVVFLGPEIMFVGWPESDGSLLELLKEHLLVLVLWRLGRRRVEFIESKNQVVLVQ